MPVRMVGAKGVRNGTGVTHSGPARRERPAAVRMGCVRFVVLSPSGIDPNW
jgi:hypothetical protein